MLGDSAVQRRFFKSIDDSALVGWHADQVRYVILPLVGRDELQVGFGPRPRASLRNTNVATRNDTTAVFTILLFPFLFVP